MSRVSIMPKSDIILYYFLRATVGESSSGPHVAVLCEYDALPEIGHACGHNLIAEVGIGAGLGIRAALDSMGGKLGKVCCLFNKQKRNQRWAFAL